MARQSGGFHAGRPEAPAPPPPGLAARVAAARAVAEAVTSSRPLDERLAADLTQQRGGLDARDRGLARSIATVSLRRLGTIRKALARRLEKGMPKRGGALEWTLVVAAAQILFLDIARPCGGRPRGQSDARRAGQRPIRRARQRRAARNRPRPRRNSRQFRSPGGRYARLARPALALDLWRERHARHRLSASLGADARPQRQKRPGRLGGAAGRNRPADRLGAPRHPRAHRRARRLCGRPMVGAGRCGGLAGQAPPAGSRHADRRSLRRAGRKSSRTGCGGG